MSQVAIKKVGRDPLGEQIKSFILGDLTTPQNTDAESDILKLLEDDSDSELSMDDFIHESVVIPVQYQQLVDKHQLKLNRGIPKINDDDERPPTNLDKDIPDQGGSDGIDWAADERTRTTSPASSAALSKSQPVSITTVDLEGDSLSKENPSSVNIAPPNNAQVVPLVDLEAEDSPNDDRNSPDIEVLSVVSLSAKSISDQIPVRQKISTFHYIACYQLQIMVWDATYELIMFNEGCLCSPVKQELGIKFHNAPTNQVEVLVIKDDQTRLGCNKVQFLTPIKTDIIKKPGKSAEVVNEHIPNNMTFFLPINALSKVLMSLKKNLSIAVSFLRICSLYQRTWLGLISNDIKILEGIIGAVQEEHQNATSTGAQSGQQGGAEHSTHQSVLQINPASKIAKKTIASAGQPADKPPIVIVVSSRPSNESNHQDVQGDRAASDRHGVHQNEHQDSTTLSHAGHLNQSSSQRFATANTQDMVANAQVSVVQIIDGQHGSSPSQNRTATTTPVSAVPAEPCSSNLGQSRSANANFGMIRNVRSSRLEPRTGPPPMDHIPSTTNSQEQNLAPQNTIHHFAAPQNVENPGFGVRTLPQSRTVIASIRYPEPALQNTQLQRPVHQNVRQSRPVTENIQRSAMNPKHMNIVRTLKPVTDLPQQPVSDSQNIQHPMPLHQHQRQMAQNIQHPGPSHQKMQHLVLGHQNSQPPVAGHQLEQHLVRSHTNNQQLVPGQQSTQHPVPSSQHMHHPVSGHKNIQHPMPRHQNIQYIVPGHQNIQNPVPGHQNIQHPVPGHQNIQHPVPGHQNIQHPVPGHQNVQHPVPGHQNVQHPVPGHQNIQHSGPGYQNIQHPVPGHQNIQHPLPNNHNIQHFVPNQQTIQRTPVSGNRNIHYAMPVHQSNQNYVPGNKSIQQPLLGHQNTQHPVSGHQNIHHPAHSLKNSQSSRSGQGPTHGGNQQQVQGLQGLDPKTKLPVTPHQQRPGPMVSNFQPLAPQPGLLVTTNRQQISPGPPNKVVTDIPPEPLRSGQSQVSRGQDQAGIGSAPPSQVGTYPTLTGRLSLSSAASVTASLDEILRSVLSDEQPNMSEANLSHFNALTSTGETNKVIVVDNSDSQALTAINGETRDLFYFCLSNHDAEILTTCPLCNHNFVYMTALVTHLVKAHSLSENILSTLQSSIDKLKHCKGSSGLVCSVADCQRLLFHSLIDYVLHVDEHRHASHIFPCSKCSCVFLSVASFYKNHNCINLGLQLKKVDSFPIDNSLRDEEIKVLGTCIVCSSFSIHYATGILHHMAMEANCLSKIISHCGQKNLPLSVDQHYPKILPKRPVECQQCGHVSKDQLEFFLHRDHHQTYAITCKHCKKIFASPCFFYNHFCGSSGRTRYFCYFCNSSKFVKLNEEVSALEPAPKEARNPSVISKSVPEVIIDAPGGAVADSNEEILVPSMDLFSSEDIGVEKPALVEAEAPLASDKPSERPKDNVLPSIEYEFEKKIRAAAMMAFGNIHDLPSDDDDDDGDDEEDNDDEGQQSGNGGDLTTTEASATCPTSSSTITAPQTSNEAASSDALNSKSLAGPADPKAKPSPLENSPTDFEPIAAKVEPGSVASSSQGLKDEEANKKVKFFFDSEDSDEEDEDTPAVSSQVSKKPKLTLETDANAIASNESCLKESATPLSSANVDLGQETITEEEDSSLKRVNPSEAVGSEDWTDERSFEDDSCDVSALTEADALTGDLLSTGNSSPGLPEDETEADLHSTEDFDGCDDPSVDFSGLNAQEVEDKMMSDFYICCDCQPAKLIVDAEHLINHCGANIKHTRITPLKTCKKATVRLKDLRKNPKLSNYFRVLDGIGQPTQSVQGEEDENVMSEN